MRSGGVVVLSRISGFMGIPFFSPLVDSAIAGPEEAKNLSGEKVLRLIQIRLTTPSLEKSRQLVKPIRRKLESPIPVPETQSAFHPRAQLNAFRRRDARLQSRSFARWNQSLDDPADCHTAL